MKLKPEVKMMIQALFPENVAIREAPADGTSVNLVSFDAKRLMDYLRRNTDGDTLLPTDSLDEESVPLHKISEGVLAGMSQKTKVVYVRVTDGE